VDGSNTITADDCNMVCAGQMPKASIQDFIEAADKNGDGHVSLEEFGAYLRKPPVKACSYESQNHSTSKITSGIEGQPRSRKHSETSAGLLYPAFPLRLVVVILVSLCLLLFCPSSKHRFSCPPRLLFDFPHHGQFEASTDLEPEPGHTTIMTATARCVTEEGQLPFDATGIDLDWHNEDGHLASWHSSRA
jgi:hypothetical protein